MKTGVGLAVIAVGAILAFAVTTNTSVFNLHTAGWVLPAPGALGSPEAANHIDANPSTRDLSTSSAGLRPGETEVIEDIYED
jgi:hypothetical protein